jgi:hypothetical protein
MKTKNFILAAAMLCMSCGFAKAQGYGPTTTLTFTSISETYSIILSGMVSGTNVNIDDGYMCYPAYPLYISLFEESLYFQFTITVEPGEEKTVSFYSLLEGDAVQLVSCDFNITTSSYVTQWETMYYGNIELPHDSPSGHYFYDYDGVYFLPPGAAQLFFNSTQVDNYTYEYELSDDIVVGL